MASPGTSPFSDNAELIAPWTAKSLWACTARHQKTIIDRLTARSLQLSIGGAVLATASEQMGHFYTPGVQRNPNVLYWTAKAIGVLGAMAVTLAAYLSRSTQSDSRVRTWTRCRSAAESLKSGIFLYRARVLPFDGPDRIAQLTQRVEKTIADLKDIEPRQPHAESVPNLGPMTVAQYIKDRAQEQIDWYTKRAREHQAKADRLRTITASITAHLKNQQYQMLVATYSATALRLSLLCGEWQASGRTDADTVDRNLFIKKCEETIAAENGGWSALWETSSTGNK